jgi:pyrroloquinoline quinone biosynthesis protein B
LIVRVLGTAAGGGVPQWNCRCANCESARAGAAPERLQASLAISSDGTAWALVNATTDVRRQLEQLPKRIPHGLRTTPVSAVLLTDANIDHAAGLLDLRQAQSLRIFSSDVVRDTLTKSNSMFGALAGGDRSWTTFDARERRRDVPGVVPGLRTTAIDVPGLLPAFAGAHAVPGAATAYLFESGAGPNTVRLLYAPIFSHMSDALLSAADACDAVFLDGSFWSDDELASLGLGSRSAREMGHAPIGGADGWLAAVGGHASTAAPHRYCTHVNNSNPVLDGRSAEARALREANLSIAVDGAEIVLDGRG